MKDLICGMEVAEPPKIRVERGGVVYGFCSERCKRLFEEGAGPKAMNAPSTAKGYLILTGVFAAILAFTAAKGWLAGGGTTREAMSDFMGAFFITFGAFKMLDIRSFADAFRTYDLVAAKSRAYALAYPAIQLLLGTAYLTRFEPQLTSSAALLVMFVSSAGVAKALASKKKIRCTCLGTKIALPMSTISFIEDALMVVMAAVMLLT